MINLTHDTIYDAYNKSVLVSDFITDLKTGDFVDEYESMLSIIFDEQYSKESAIKSICKVLNIENNQKNTNHIAIMLDDMGIHFDYESCSDLEREYQDFLTDHEDDLYEKKLNINYWNI